MTYDHIDVTPAPVTTADYRRWYRKLAAMNLARVREGTAAQKQHYPHEVGVWHIQTMVDTYPIAREMLAELGYTSFDTGVDAGAGTVTLFDFIPTRRAVTLDIVRAYCKFLGGSSVVGDLEALPMPAECADIVVCSDILEHVLSLNNALSEVRRVLKPQGLLLVCVPWRQVVGGKLDKFSHVRTFNEKTWAGRFAGWTELARRIVTRPEYRWLTQIIAVMQKGNQ